ncbi:hypothetical protein [Alkalicoccus luteus]
METMSIIAFAVASGAIGLAVTLNGKVIKLEKKVMELEEKLKEG